MFYENTSSRYSKAIEGLLEVLNNYWTKKSLLPFWSVEISIAIFFCSGSSANVSTVTAWRMLTKGIFWMFSFVSFQKRPVIVPGIVVELYSCVDTWRFPRIKPRKIFKFISGDVWQVQGRKAAWLISIVDLWYSNGWNCCLVPRQVGNVRAEAACIWVQCGAIVHTCGRIVHLREPYLDRLVLVMAWQGWDE